MSDESYTPFEDVELTSTQLMDLLKICNRTLYRWSNNGKLKVRRTVKNHEVRMRVGDLVAWALTHKWPINRAKLRKYVKKNRVFLRFRHEELEFQHRIDARIGKQKSHAPSYRQQNRAAIEAARGKTARAFRRD